jgi:hypothetical protein
MAGYNRGIVATRKLNENNKARLGRGGDTKIREVDNRKSHVNALEAYLIDVNGKAGEEYAKRVGAGTVNPLTGMPEYRALDSNATVDWHSQPWYTAMGEDMQALYDMYKAGDITDTEWTGALRESGSGGPPPDMTENDLTYNTGEGGNNYTPYGEGEMPTGNLNYNQLTDVAGQGNINEYLQEAFGADAGQDYSMYFQDLTRGAGTADDPFDFLERGFETEKKELRLQSERTDEALGAVTTRAAGGVRQAARTAQSRSGFATQGSITGQMTGQLRDIGQDFKAGQRTIGEDYGLAREKALTSYQQGVYGEEKKITDRFYDMIGTLTQAGGWEIGSGSSNTNTFSPEIETMLEDMSPEMKEKVEEEITDPRSNVRVGGKGGGNRSDIRLKEDINYIGTSSSGLNIYRFKYKDQDGVYEGVMSNEIPSNAVTKGSDGYDMVDYNMIDVDFKRIK